MRKCIGTALFLMLLGASASAQPLTFDGPTAVQSFGEHRTLVVVDSDGDGRADHLFRLWSERELPRVDEAFARAHVEFEPHRLRILADGRELCLSLGDLPSEPGALAGYGLNHEWGGAKVALHRIVVEGGVARYVAEAGAADWPQ
ncbi:MAG TPA: hypothetical protein VGR02_01105 [Thermoanaerobaculia bacterium]|nr:hypothetical protein [Thermoanaerobaculia bacterium]